MKKIKFFLVFAVVVFLAGCAAFIPQPGDYSPKEEFEKVTQYKKGDSTVVSYNSRLYNSSRRQGAVNLQKAAHTTDENAVEMTDTYDTEVSTNNHNRVYRAESSRSAASNSQAQLQKYGLGGGDLANGLYYQKPIYTTKPATPPQQPRTTFSATGQEVANAAMQLAAKKIPYRNGGKNHERSLDCSGFTSAVYQSIGISIPIGSGAQKTAGQKINSLTDALPGDLIGFSNHVAIYLGNGLVAHAYAITGKTCISRLEDVGTPTTIRRYLPDPRLAAQNSNF